MMFKTLILQTLYGLSDAQAEFQILGRRSFGRFLSLDDDDNTPDETTFWWFREALVRANAIDALFTRFDAHLKGLGYLAMGGQIVDASICRACLCHTEKPHGPVHPHDRHRRACPAILIILPGWIVVLGILMRLRDIRFAFLAPAHGVPFDPSIPGSFTIPDMPQASRRHALHAGRRSSTYPAAKRVVMRWVIGGMW